jgi:isocitrate dehydrogenase
MDEDRLAGKETSLNPLGMVEALLSAMDHAGNLEGGRDDVVEFTSTIRTHVHQAMASGNGTRDLCGPSGLTTEEFVDYVAAKLN